MLSSILYNIGLYDKIYDEDYNLLKIKNNLKKTYTLKKKFYFPTIKEIQNKYHNIKLKNKPTINVNDIIFIKNNLKKCV
tara:strand:- start:834 stop:1070 length:237 start_codon:yes stop_codon:yes gene_type:complete